MASIISLAAPERLHNNNKGLLKHAYFNSNTCLLSNRMQTRQQGGVTPIPSVLRSATVVKRQVNGQDSFKAKDISQTFLVDSQSYTNKVVYKNTAKINGIRSKVKIKFGISRRSKLKIILDQL